MPWHLSSFADNMLHLLLKKTFYGQKDFQSEAQDKNSDRKIQTGKAWYCLTETIYFMTFIE